jgi:metallo-beta-lactamase family protein
MYDPMLGGSASRLYTSDGQSLETLPRYSDTLYWVLSHSGSWFSVLKTLRLLPPNKDLVPMQITHHGGHIGVTGSCHELQYSDGHSVLIDCGMFQGRDAKEHGDMHIEFPLNDVQALILTHVHIDHIGRIPYLFEAGFNKPIYCTRPTAKMLPIMLEDAMRLGITRNRRTIKEFLDDLKKLVRPIPYGKWVNIASGKMHDELADNHASLEFRFQPAGHILGAAYVETDYQDQRVVFSGDLGSRCTPIMRDPVSPERADVLILESTYGDRNHEGRETRLHRLESILCETMQNKGVTIIPAFSLGRTQELLYELNMIMEGIGHKTQCTLLKQIDVMVDSPLAIKLTDIYEQLREYWDDEAREILTVDKQPLVFRNLVEIDRGGDHRETLKYLLNSGKPAIIIAGSGMCTGGRVVDYLKTFLGRENTDVLFVGYQGEGTPGKAIQNCQGGQGKVWLDHEEILVKAKTYTLTGYSAHADQSDLIHFVEGIATKPREIRLVHGENAAKQALGEKLRSLGYHVAPDGLAAQ